MKKILLLIIFIIIFFPYKSAKTMAKFENRESIILLDVARNYYTVDDIKKYIDLLSLNENSTLQLHFSDNENVGIECKYLDQTIANAVYDSGIYTNPVTNKKFLSYNQIIEIINYAKMKNVNFIPEIDIPAHMNGFFTLAINKFGIDYVRKRNTGIAWGSGNEIGHLDIINVEAKKFLYNLYDEYTNFFKDLKYFSIGFDEYTFRNDEKIDFLNEISSYLINKNFVVRMWNDSLTKDNITKINKNIQIQYWLKINDDYATIDDLQKNGFNVIETNNYYLFFVPSLTNTNISDLDYAVNDILNNWDLNKWDSNNNVSLVNYNNILGAMICVWGENSLNVDKNIILYQTKRMYNAMFSKLDKNITNMNFDQNDNKADINEKNLSIKNPKTNDKIITYISIFLISLIVLIRKK